MNEPSIAKLGASEPVQSLVERGKQLLKEKRLDEALPVFQQIVAQDPSSKTAHLALGRILFRMKRPEEARPHFEEGIRLDPSRAKPYLMLARTVAALGDYDKAMEALRNALAINSKLAVAYLGMGALFARMNKPAEAEKQFVQAIRINPRMVDARRRLAQILGQSERFDEAIEQLTVALRIQPGNSETLTGLGRIHLLKADYRAARDAFHQAVEGENKKTQVNALMGLAEACLQTGQIAEAESALQRVPEKDQAKAKMHKLWGDLYKSQGFAKQALEEYRAAELLASEQELDLDEADFGDLPELDDDEGWEAALSSARDSALQAMTQRQAQAQNRRRK